MRRNQRSSRNVALAHGLGEVAVGGGDDADIDRHRLAAADAVDQPLLDRAQQFRLQAHVHFGDFVEQQRAAIGLLEFADAASERAGEGALLVAEQLGLQEVIRDRRAIDGNERLPGAGRAGVQVARQHFLAGAALAGDQHGGVGAGDLLGELDDARHRLVAIDHLAPVVGDGREHGRDQVGVGRQRDVFLGAGMDGVDRGTRVVGDAAGHDRDMDALGVEPVHQVADIEGDVDHQQVGAAAGAQHGERLLVAVGVGDAGALVQRDFARGGELASKRTDDQESHGIVPLTFNRMIIFR